MVEGLNLWVLITDVVRQSDLDRSPFKSDGMKDKHFACTSVSSGMCVGEGRARLKVIYNLLHSRKFPSAKFLG